MFQIASFKIICTDSTEILFSQILLKSFFSFHYFFNCLSYIKEFVHGDFGRTKPNLTSLLGADCDILELDVQVCITRYQLVLERYRFVLLALIDLCY